MSARRNHNTRLHLRRLCCAGALACAAIGTWAVAAPTHARGTLESTTAADGVAITHAEVLDIVESMERAYKNVDDYTATFVKRERVRGRLLPREVMELKFAKPFKVYLRWGSGKHEGQEVLYVDGWNGGKIRAHTGKFPDITVDLAPDGNLAMRGNRHPITDLGLGNTIKLLARDVRLAGARPGDGASYVDLGTFKIGGATARCVEATTPSLRWSPYYAHKARLCVSTKTDMPLRVMVWDRDGDLLEDYTFKNLKLNVGLTDADFDPDSYAF
jgi:outer membrane lipoprotein-sorting protein